MIDYILLDLVILILKMNHDWKTLRYKTETLIPRDLLKNGKPISEEITEEKIEIIFCGSGIILIYREGWHLIDMRRGQGGQIETVIVGVVNEPRGEEMRMEIPVHDFWFRNAPICRRYCRDNGIPYDAYCDLSEEKYRRCMEKHNVIFEFNKQEYENVMCKGSDTDSTLPFHPKLTMYMEDECSDVEHYDDAMNYMRGDMLNESEDEDDDTEG